MYYKILVRRDGKLFSLIDIFDDLDDWVVEYPVGEQVKPKVGKVFVFNYLYYAKEYAIKFIDKGDDRTLEIWSCDAHGEITELDEIAVPYSNSIERFWNRASDDNDLTANLPESTVAIDEITLREQLLVLTCK